MPRPDPGTPPELPATIPPRTDYITQTRHYRLITPLFGGGVEPGRCDPVTVVRAGEIRGHLRFWWRATRGGHFSGNPARMKEAEDALWGAAGNEQGGGPSKVEVVVTEWPGKTETKVFQADPRNSQLHIGSPRSKYSYVAFPLNESNGSVIAPFDFTINITFHRHPVTAEGKQLDGEVEIQAALWAWETFGGIGARTRRGFGALQLTQINDTEITTIPTDELRQSIFDGLQTHVVAGTWPPDVPHLLQQPTSDWIRVLPFPNQSAMDAWVELFSTLKDFRHQRPGSTKLIKGSMRTVPGRNRWPEPDVVRRLTKSRSTRHAQAISDLNKFPRAVFGLPIIFEFNPDDRKDGDPKGKYTLMGKSKDDKNVERLASPLILRPLASSNGAVGIALVLAGNRLPDQLILTQEKRSWNVAATLTQDEANTIMQTDGRTPLLVAETNVLRAFLKYLEHEVNP